VCTTSFLPLFRTADFAFRSERRAAFFAFRPLRPASSLHSLSSRPLARSRRRLCFPFLMRGENIVDRFLPPSAFLLSSTADVVQSRGARTSISGSVKRASAVLQVGENAEKRLLSFFPFSLSPFVRAAREGTDHPSLHRRTRRETGTEKRLFVLVEREGGVRGLTGREEEEERRLRHCSRSGCACSGRRGGIGRWCSAV
jgi:hypothetical protein